MTRTDRARAFAPDFVSAELLAFRLDCSRSTIDHYVRSGYLPKPKSIGNLIRWDFEEVRDFILAQNSSNDANAFSDPYMLGVESAASEKA